MPKKNPDQFTQLALILKNASLEPELKLTIIEAASHATDEKIQQIIEIVDGFVKEQSNNEQKLKDRLVNIHQSFNEKSKKLSDETEIQLTKLSGQVDEDENSVKLESLRKDL